MFNGISFGEPWMEWYSGSKANYISTFAITVFLGEISYRAFLTDGNNVTRSGPVAEEFRSKFPVNLRWRVWEQRREYWSPDQVVLGFKLPKYLPGYWMIITKNQHYVFMQVGLAPQYSADQMQWYSRNKVVGESNWLIFPNVSPTFIRLLQNENIIVYEIHIKTNYIWIFDNSYKENTEIKNSLCFVYRLCHPLH